MPGFECILSAYTYLSMLTMARVPYSQVVFKFGGWPQTDRIKILGWRNLNFMVAPQVRLSGSVAISRLRYWNKAMSLQTYKK